jgi:hypothetical protein
MSCSVSGMLTAAACGLAASTALPGSNRLWHDMVAIRQKLLNRSPKNFRKSPKSNLDRMLGSGSMPMTAQVP